MDKPKAKGGTRKGKISPEAKEKGEPQFQNTVSKYDAKVQIYQVLLPKERSAMHLNLELFKTQPCPIREDHNKIKCVYYHANLRDRRRNTGYSSFMCLHVKKST